MERKEIAETILAQLGGNRALAVMMGASNFYSLDAVGPRLGGLQFTIKAFGKPRVNRIVIELNAADLYNIEFLYISGKERKHKVVAVKTDVYAEDLISVCEQATGLVFRIPRFVA